MSLTKRYAPSAEPVEAVLITESNIDLVADWCGGEVSTDQSYIDTAWDKVVLVPGIPNSFSVPVGWYLVKDRKNKFRRWQKEYFEREYHEVGLRQAGPVFRTSLTGRTIGDME